jgi:parallel beta-helix repeat protein
MTIDSNVFNDNNENAMSFLSYSSRIWVKNNIVNNTGMIPGAGTNNQNSGDAIDVYGPGSIVEYNSINNTGHIAIAMRHGDGMIVRNNFITNFGMTRYDAGGIYSWNQDSTITASRVIDHNIILYSKEATEGIGKASPSLFGIYLDGDSKNTFITNNTVAHCTNGDGIFILNSGSCTIINNVSYDNGRQLAFIRAYGGGMNIANMIVKNNIFISKTTTQLTFYYRDDNSSFNFGVADSNYFSRPIDDKVTITTQISNVPTNRTFAGWQNFSGQDTRSKMSPKTISDISDLRFEYNGTSSAKKIGLEAKYMDVSGNVYSGFITLAPFSSVVLIKAND